MIKAFKQTKIIILLLTFVFITTENSLHSQVSLRPTAATKGNTYALIIGIKDYKDDKIRDLRYADKDAEEFVNFLRSPNGGDIAEENITLLTNEQATISNIYAAIMLLESKAKSGDRLYFYFSGHGDVENSIYKLGFLIAYDTPYGNYLNNAIRIEDINIMANTLSIQKDVEVILITDACHSGKLAGSDNRGRMLVGEQLAQVENNEIRIASCEASQLSQEDQVWGGGRGAFSFHLINGLNGAADEGRKNGIITLLELKNYLESNVFDDVLEFKEEEQIPVVEGKSTAKLSVISSGSSTPEVNTIIQNRSDGSGARSVKQNNSNLFLDIFNVIPEQDLENRALLQQLVGMTDIEILNWCKENYSIEDSYYQFNESDFDRFTQIKLSLATYLHNIVQENINYYLSGDTEELKRRQFYRNISEVQYYKYVDMLDIAAKLVEPTSQLYHIITVKRHYFNGLVNRLLIPTSTNPDSLRLLALEDMQKAYELNPDAPYINNEMGILANHNDIEKAIAYYQRAIELAPSWSFPYSNIANAYFEQNKIEEAKKLAEKSIELNDKVYLGYFTLGKILLHQHNYLQSEEFLKKAMLLDDKQAINYLYLGHIYSDLTQFDLAEYNYWKGEASSFNTPLARTLADGFDPGVAASFPSDVKVYIDFDELKDIDSTNFLASFHRGYQYFQNDKYELAKKLFTNCALLESKDPIALYYLAVTKYYLNNAMESAYYFERATSYYENQVNELYNRYSQKYDTTDFEANIYKRATFNEEYRLYYLSDIYSSMGQNDKFVTLLRQGVNSGNRYCYYSLLDYYISNNEYDFAKQLTKIFSWGSEKEQLVGEFEVYKKIADNTADLVDQFQTLSYIALMAEAKLLDFGGGDPRVIEDIVSNPISQKAYSYMSDVENPTEMGIQYFENIEKLDQADSTLQARYYVTAGDLYSYNYQPEKAYEYYTLAKEYSNHESSNADRFIRYGNKNTKYTDVLLELQYLEKNNRLNVGQLPLYIDYTSRYGDFKKSKQLIDEFARITLYEIDTLINHEFHNAYFSEDYTLSEKLMKKMVESKTIKSHKANYWLARIKMKQQDVESVYDYLEKAINEGFSYALVMKYDENFADIRDEDAYQNLISHIDSF